MARTVPRHLYRSRRDRMVGGVAAGMAAYFDLDPTVVRLLWILAAIFSGGAVLLMYLALALIVPEEEFVLPTRRMQGSAGPGPSPAAETRRELAQPTGTGINATADEVANQAEPITAAIAGTEISLDEEIPAPERERRRVWGGIILVTLGLVFLGGNFGLYQWFRWDQYWPMVLIGIGVLMVWNRWGKREGLR